MQLPTPQFKSERALLIKLAYQGQQVRKTSETLQKLENLKNYCPVDNNGFLSSTQNFISLFQIGKLHKLFNPYRFLIAYKQALSNLLLHLNAAGIQTLLVPVFPKLTTQIFQNYIKVNLTRVDFKYSSPQEAFLKQVILSLVKPQFTLIQGVNPTKIWLSCQDLLIPNIYSGVNNQIIPHPENPQLLSFQPNQKTFFCKGQSVTFQIKGQNYNLMKIKGLLYHRQILNYSQSPFKFQVQQCLPFQNNFAVTCYMKENYCFNSYLNFRSDYFQPVNYQPQQDWYQFTKNGIDFPHGKDILEQTIQQHDLYAVYIGTLMKHFVQDCFQTKINFPSYIIRILSGAARNLFLASPFHTNENTCYMRNILIDKSYRPGQATMVLAMLANWADSQWLFRSFDVVDKYSFILKRQSLVDYMKRLHAIGKLHRIHGNFIIQNSKGDFIPIQRQYQLGSYCQKDTISVPYFFQTSYLEQYNNTLMGQSNIFLFIQNKFDLDTFKEYGITLFRGCNLDKFKRVICLTLRAQKIARKRSPIVSGFRRREIHDSSQSDQEDKITMIPVFFMRQKVASKATPSALIGKRIIRRTVQKARIEEKQRKMDQQR